MRRNVGSGLAIIAAFMFLAVFLALLIVFFPLKFTGVVSIGVLAIIGIVVALLLPDSRNDKARITTALLVLAIATKFLWPAFSYIPVPGLPFKNPQRWVWLFCIGYWVWSLLSNATLRKRTAQRLTGHPLSAMVLAFFAWRLASCAGSQVPTASIFTAAMEIFDYLPAYLMAISWIRDERDVRTLTSAMVVVLLLITLATVVEARMQSNPFMFLLPYDPGNAEFIAVLGTATFRAGSYRAKATFGHALLLAQYLACMLPLVLGSLTRSVRPWIRLCALLGCLLLPVAMWATHTRTSAAASALVLALLAILLAWRLAVRKEGGFQRHVAGYFGLIIAVGLLLVAIAVVYSWAVGRTSQEAGSSIARLRMIQLSFEAFAESPIFGHGPGSGAFKAGIKSSDGTISIDSYFLTQLVESGLLGLLLFSGFIAAATIGGMREVIRATRSGLTLRLLWCLVILSFGLSAAVLSTPHNMPLLYLALGVVVALTPNRAHERQLSQSAVMANYRVGQPAMTSTGQRLH